MPYSINRNELLLENNRLTALEIWSNEQNPSDDAPHLSDLNLWFNPSFATVHAELEKSESGECGTINIYAEDTYGHKVKLAPGHTSDHVIIGDAVMPLHREEIEGIAEELAKNNVKPGTELTVSSFLACRSMQDKYWFTQKWTFDAKQWATSIGDNYSSVQPLSFNATLSDYQVQGSNWLSMMVSQGVGGILGDGMGLGKTVQMIKAICDRLETKPEAQILIICPSALVENWRREIIRFTEGIDVQCHIGNNRSRNYRNLKAPIIITSYDLARIDNPVFGQIAWDIVVLDEAQFIKNPSSQRTKAIKKLPREVGIAITGTPFENHMTDVWSLMDFCCPGFLGSISEFTGNFQDEEISADQLGQIVAPFLLRRKSSDVKNDLPDLIKIPVPIKLSNEEAADYELRKKNYVKDSGALGAFNNLIGDLSAPQGTERFLSKLKFNCLQTVVEEVFANREKIIVFADRLHGIKYIQSLYSKTAPTFVLTGDIPTEERMPLIDKFSAIEGAAILICNPIVGGGRSEHYRRKPRFPLLAAMEPSNHRPGGCPCA